MSIKLITYSCANNYGAVLQTYGLYCVLKEFTDDVEVIDYITERYNVDDNSYGEKAIKTSKWRYVPFAKTWWKKRIVKQMKRNRIPFRSFLQKQVVFTKPYYSLDELIDDVPRADIYVTGSDQLWNPEYLWSGLIDIPYYLGFLTDDSKRISYATSFGKSTLSKPEIEAAYPYLKKYNSISVRESSGLKILEKMNLKGTEVVDPTILAGADCFLPLISADVPKKKYVLLFQINFNNDLYRAVKQFAARHNLKLIVIVPEEGHKTSKIQNCLVLPTVEEWLWYFKNAEFIFTDSFHATAFSILFNKNFASSMIAGNNGRIKNILKLTKLENRQLQEISENNIENIAQCTIDYKIVNRIVESLREQSISWLRESLQ